MGRKADLRAAKAEDARNPQYGFVTLIHDRFSGTIEIEHPFMGMVEAFGVISTAEALARAALETAPYRDQEEDTA